MITNSIKITENGQVVIPKKVSDKLNSDIIAFEIIGNNVMIIPIKSVAGSLEEYSKDLGSFDEVRKLAWGKIEDDWKK